MKMSIRAGIFCFFLIVVHIPSCFASVFTYGKSFGKIELGSATHFEIPSHTYLDTSSIQFQFGPYLHSYVRLSPKNILILNVEHLFWHEGSRTEHRAQRAVTLDIYLKRKVNRRVVFGLGYVLSPNKTYYTHNYLSYSDQQTAAGLIGMGGFFTFSDGKLTASLHAKFVNDHYFSRDSELLYFIDALGMIALSPNFSFAIKYYHRFNSSFYSGTKSAINPFASFSWKSITFDFGPVFSTSAYPTRFSQKFNFQRTLGYNIERR